ncbi:hypothetical protein GCM10007860_14320 [Chitiniphilus shinanonensis]|uniref:Tetratricopeptide repeat protein n=1 Tax=Chitiniphilus shinanonensis TaxID=553088 RepID=A0ABQ6BQI9_9NEIS|nr:tetratricopeptide repeat protein [Chitiniphilus shinanonensis]GLS04285.1 hypothetical protein GCM10007860_14320 [Chitiniphilus shinanonensis]
MQASNYQDNGWYLSPEKQLLHLDGAMQRAVESAAPLDLASCLVERGRCLESLWQPQHALDAYQQAEEVIAPQPGDAAILVRCRARLGSAAIHYAHADYAQALEDWQWALRMARLAGHDLAAGEALLGLGRICSALGRADAALSYNEQALRMPDLDSRVQAMVLLNVVSNLNALGRFGDMAQRLRQVEQLIACTPGLPFIAEWHTYCGMACAGLGDLSSARPHLRRAVALADGANNHWIRAFASLQLGKLLARTRDFVGARRWLTQAQEIGEGLGLAHTLMDIHHAQSQLCEMMGNVAEAFEHHKLYHHYHEWAHDGLRRELVRELLPRAA